MPVIIGIVAASASRAMTDLSDRIARRLNNVGKVSGSSTENSSASATVSITKPYTGMARPSRCNGFSAAPSSDGSGSSAVDLMELLMR